MSLTILVNRGVAARQDAKREIHHLSARKQLEQEYKGRDEILSGKEVEAVGGGGTYKPLKYVQDKGSLIKLRDEYKRNYERGLPVTLPLQTQNELWKRAKQLKDEFVIGMLSKSEMHPVKEHVISINGKLINKVVCDYDKLNATKAIERNKAWETKNNEKIREFKNIMRQLEPDNPNLPNVERFRRD